MNDSYFTGLLQGFTGRKREVEKENIRQADLASEREQKVLMTLLQADDPEVRNLALSGLIETSGPGKKAKGLGGWIGQRQQSPVFGQLQQLIRTPTLQPVEEEKTTLPSTQFAGGAALGQTPQGMEAPPAPRAAITTPPTGGGMAPTSPVQPGAPPPTPVSVTQAPPTPFSITRMAMRPRQVFLPPEEQYKRTAMAKEVGDIVGMRAGLRAAGFGDEESSQIIRQKLAGRYAAQLPFQHVAIEVPDDNGTYVQRMASYDRRTNQYLDEYQQPIYGARPLQHTASTSLGTDKEYLAQLLFKKRAIDLLPEQLRQLDTIATQRKNGMTVKDALTAARQFLPNASLDEQLQLAESLKAGTEPTAVGAPAATPGLGGMATLPTTSGQAPTAGTPPPAPRKISELAPPGLGTATRETGKPLPASVASALAKAKSTNDLIDQATAALAPFKHDNTLQGSIKIAEGYRHGEYSPLYSAAAQLSDLAGLQSSAQAQLTGGSSRAIRFYIDRRQHVPRLPSGRQAMASHVIGATGTERSSELLKGDEGGFDTPQMMYQKLLQAKENNQNFIRELEQATSGVRPAASHGAPPTPTTQPAATTPVLYRDAQGVWRMGTPPQ